VLAILLNELLDKFFVEPEIRVFPPPLVVKIDDQLEGVLVAVEEFVFFIAHLLVGFKFELVEAQLLNVIQTHVDAFL
jgi:hypothetical protein